MSQSAVMERTGVRCGNCSTFGAPVFHKSVDAVRQCFVAKYAAQAQPVTPPPAPTLTLWQKVKQVDLATFGNKQYGYFAVTDPRDGVVKFFRMDRPLTGKKAGMTFLMRQASQEWYPVRGGEQGRFFELIVADVAVSQALYATALGQCYRCGKILTDTESRERGVGPICWGKM